MAVYAIWNNKGGVGKSYLTFQIACEYARTRMDPQEKVLVLDLCPQANASSMLLGGIKQGEEYLNKCGSEDPRRTIAGYVRERISSPYHNPRVGSHYPVQLSTVNSAIPENLHLVVGDGELEVLASRVSHATNPGPDDAWLKVHRWLTDLIEDIREAWNQRELTVFIDCNPSFGVYTELALAAADRLILPFSADGSSKRAVRTVLGLVYGAMRQPGAQQSEFFLKSKQNRLKPPQIYCYIGNRLTQANQASASAFHAVVEDIGNEIFEVWKQSSSHFCLHPKGSQAPKNKKQFHAMFQMEVNDANTASVVSSANGIPLVNLRAGPNSLPEGKSVQVNQTQLDKLQPNIQDLVSKIE